MSFWSRLSLEDHWQSALFWYLDNWGGTHCPHLYRHLRGTSVSFFAFTQQSSRAQISSSSSGISANPMQMPLIPQDPSYVTRWLCMDNYICLLLFGEIYPTSACWFKGLTIKSLIFRGLALDIEWEKQIFSRFESHSILFRFKCLNLCMSGEKWEDCLWW